MAKKLKYVGNGAFFPGVPAADHECGDDAEAERLAASGLYAYATGEEPALEDRTVAQLKDIMEERGIAVDPKARKADLVEALRQAQDRLAAAASDSTADTSEDDANTDDSTSAGDTEGTESPPDDGGEGGKG